MSLTTKYTKISGWLEVRSRRVFSRKEHKVRKGLKPENTEPETRKPETNRKAKPFIRRGS